MAALTIWLFDEVRTDDVLDTVATIHRNGWIEVLDASLVRWPAGASRPSWDLQHDLRGASSFDRSFWQLLLGLTFFPSTFGAGSAAAGSSVARTADDLGIGPGLADELRRGVRPGSAALFLWSSGSLAREGRHAEEIRSVLKGVPIRLLSSNLAVDAVDRLRETFRPA